MEQLQRNQGYSLLYKLMGDEAGVGDILIFKHADESVSGLVKEIGAACKDAESRMEEFRKADHGLSFDETGLPVVEAKSRELASKSETRALLGSSGKEFEVRLIVTQIEAMGYGEDLAEALEDRENDPRHKAFLKGLAEQCGGFRERLLKLLGRAGG
jgi:hypothetical protein